MFCKWKSDKKPERILIIFGICFRKWNENRFSNLRDFSANVSCMKSDFKRSGKSQFKVSFLIFRSMYFVWLIVPRTKIAKVTGELAIKWDIDTLILKFLKSFVKVNGQNRVKETLAGFIVPLRLTIPKRSTSVIQEADLKDLRRPFLNLFYKNFTITQTNSNIAKIT